MRDRTRKGFERIVIPAETSVLSGIASETASPSIFSRKELESTAQTTHKA